MTTLMETLAVKFEEFDREQDITVRVVAGADADAVIGRLLVVLIEDPDVEMVEADVGQYPEPARRAA